MNPHFVFEALAYGVGFQWYRIARRRGGDFLAGPDRTWVITAAIVGAAVGSKLLYWLEDPAMTLAHWSDPMYLMAGKTIVGGLLGGTLAVEWVKDRIGVNRRTGDLFAIPLAVGIAIGRVGCFLAGLADNTYGVATSLPWGVDFGDGIHRHPTQLYEIVFLLVLALWIHRLGSRAHREGDLFRCFLIGYLAFRLLVDFLKPEPAFGGLSSLQWWCLAVLIFYRRDLPALWPGPLPTKS